MPTALERLSHAVTGAIDRRMYKLGHYSARHPVRVSLISVFCMLFLACGVLVHVKYENTGDKIWPPQDSESVVNHHYIQRTLGEFLKGESVIVEVKAPYTNVLDKRVLSAAIDAANRLRGVSKGDITLQRICSTVPGTSTCKFNSVLFHWNFDTDLLAADTDVLHTVKHEPYPSGDPASLDDLSGWNPDFTTATHFRIDLVIDTLVAERNGVSTADVTEWEQELVDLVRSWDYPEFTAYVLSGRSVDDAISASIGGDMPIVAAGICLMSVYAFCVLTRRMDTVRSRFGLTSAACGAVILGILGSTGLVSACGVLLTNLNQILLYVVFGVGIDDAFIIAASVDKELYRAREKARKAGKPDPALRGDPTREAEFADICGKGLADAGSSIAFTSITDLAAFFLGSFTSIPATSWFCLYAGTAVMAVFFMQTTLFAACLFADIRRQAVRHKDVFTCCAVPETVELKPLQELSWLQRNMKDKYAPVVARSRKFQGAVIFGFVALLATAGYGATDIERGFPVIDLTPDVHYARDYLEVQEDHWPGIQYRTVNLLFMHDTSNPVGSTLTEKLHSTQRAMYAARHAMELAPRWVSSVPTEWWFSHFLEYAANKPDLAPGISTSTAPWGGSDTVQLFTPPAGAAFGDVVNEYLVAEPRFSRDVSLEMGPDGRRQLQTSRCDLKFRPQPHEELIVDAMHETRDMLDSAVAEFRVATTTYTYMFQFLEMDAVSMREAVLNMGLALAGVALVCLIFLGSLKVSAMVVFMVAMIDVGLLGSLHFFGIRLNAISVVNLVLCVGLSVDYAAHIAHRFLEMGKPGYAARNPELEISGVKVRDIESGVKRHSIPDVLSANDRVQNTMWTLGASVFNGGISTFCAVAPLFFTNSTIFQVFFAMISTIVLLGLAHGLVLLPALLSLTGMCSQRPSRPVSPAFSSAKSVPVAQPSQFRGARGVDDVVDPASLRVEGSNPMFNPSKRSAIGGDNAPNAQTGRGASAEPAMTQAVPTLASP